MFSTFLKFITSKAVLRMAPVILGIVAFELFTLQANAAAVAGRGPVVRLNGEGFRICKAFDKKGTPAWTAKVRGKFLDNTGFTDKFKITTCFATQSECEKFVFGIENVLVGVERLFFAKCKPRVSYSSRIR